MNFMYDCIAAAEENRHVAASKAKTGPRCFLYSVLPSSDCGLWSHLWIHQSKSGDTQKQCNVVVDLDGLCSSSNEALYKYTFTTFVIKIAKKILAVNSLVL